MALVKTVEMRVLADAGDAQAKLDDLDAKAKDLDGNDIRMRFRLEDGDAKAQLDAIRAKADALGYKDVSIKVRVDGAGRAIADLAAVRHEEDEVARRGLLDRLVGGAGGGIPGGIGPFGGGLPLPALAAAIPLVGALATEAVGVASGFAAAAAGAGAFALLAMPAVKKVETAWQSLGKAQDAYARAQEKEKLDPTTANKNAVAAAALNLKLAQEQISKLPASEQAAVKGIQGLSAEFGKMSRAFAPQAFKVFADGLKVVGNLLPHVAPFASTFASGLDKLLQQAQKFTASKGFSDWLKQFRSLEGPAIASIGHGIGEVANSFGKLMTVMSGKDVGHAISIAFGAVAGTINVVTFAIRRFMQNWDGMSAAAAKAGHAVAGAFKAVGQGAAAFQNTVDHAFTAVIHGAETMVSGVVRAVSSLAGKIKGAFAGAAGWLVSAGENIVRGLIHGIESMAGAVGSAIGHIASVIRSFLPFSPAKQGPLSGAGSPDIAGAKITEMLAQGIDAKGARLTEAVKKAVELIRKELSYARDVARSTIAGLNLTSIDLSQGTVATGMQSYLASIRAFTADLKALSAQHLNKNLLRQLIAAGPVTGDEYAQSILTGGGTAGSGVAQVNALYRQIQQQSAVLGTQAARSVYGNAVDVRVDVRLVTGSKQDFALQIVKVLKEYKRNGGGAALGIA